jgi:hypothetical protein
MVTQAGAATPPYPSALILTFSSLKRSTDNPSPILPLNLSPASAFFLATNDLYACETSLSRVVDGPPHWLVV